MVLVFTQTADGAEATIFLVVPVALSVGQVGKQLGVRVFLVTKV